ncbi:MAG: hypothetical protein AUK31_01665 [Fibrobacteres bacterium CG2_30_45_31]|nr:MAG: hypothetical protein AUK31_01665 [Fibrobacteres bacterium CG2_30_45_31]
MSEQNQYDAFISYSRKDIEVAAWFQKEMEKLRVPKALPYPAGMEPLPRKLRLFRDQTDLGVRSNSFFEGLSANLAKSRDLILLCSPHVLQNNSEGLNYIDWEIREFIRIHGVEYAKNHILPVIIYGKIQSGDSREACIPTALNDLGVDFRQRNLPVLGSPEISRVSKNDKEHVLLQCLSYLARVETNIVDNRFQKERRRTMQRWLLLAGAVILALSGLAIWALVEKDKTSETLSESYFQEASRLIDEHQAGLALAYLAASMDSKNNNAAYQRFSGLMKNRSWLVQLDTLASSPHSGIHIAWSNRQEKEAVFSLEDSAQGKGTLSIYQLDPSRPPVSISVKNFRTGIFSPDGQSLLTLHGVAPEQICKRWNVSTGEFSDSLLLSDGSVPVFLSSSASYALLLTSDQKTIRLVSMKDGSIRFEQTVTSGWEWNKFAFDEKEKILAFGVKRELNFQHLNEMSASEFAFQTIDIASGSILAQIHGAGILSDWVLSPDGVHLAYSYSTGRPDDWLLVNQDLSSGKPSWTLPLKACQRLLFNPDGIHLAADLGTFGVEIHNVYRDSESKIHIDLSSPVKNWTFSHDGRRLAITTEQASLCVFNVRDGSEAVERRLLNTDVYGIQFSKTNRILTVNTGNGEKSFALQVSPVGVQTIMSKWSPSVLMNVFVEKNSSAFAFILGSYSSGTILEMHGMVDSFPDSIRQLKLSETPNCGAFSPDGRFLVLGSGKKTDENGTGQLDVYKISEGTLWQPQKWEKWVSEKAPFAVTQISFSPDGKRILVNSNTLQKAAQKALVYDMQALAKPVFSLNHGGTVSQAAFTPDGKYVITAGSDRMLKGWDIASGNMLWKQELESFPSALAISSQGKIACGMRLLHANGRVQIFAENGKPEWSSRVLRNGVNQLDFNGKGSLLGVAFFNREALIFDVSSGRIRSQDLVQEGDITSMRFWSDSDQDILCIGGKTENNLGFVEYWDPATSKKIGDITRHSDKVQGINVSTKEGILSWSNALLVAPRPLQVSTEGDDNYDQLAGELGGWTLNQWNVPEEFERTKNLSSPKGPLTRMLCWLQDTSETRDLYTGSKDPLKSYLSQLVQGSERNIERALDIRPDCVPAWKNYWFSQALDVAEKRFMGSVTGKSRDEWLKRRLQWAGLTPAQKRAYLQADPEGMRLADFQTRELYTNHPNSASAWMERGIFLKLANENVQAKEVLENAAKLDPKNSEIKNELVGLETSPQAISSLLAQSLPMLQNDDSATVERICNYAEKFLPNWVMANGALHTGEKLDEILALLRQKVKSSISFDDQLKIQILAEKMTSLFFYLPEGPKLSNTFNQGLLDLFDHSSLSVASESRRAIQSMLAFNMLLQNRTTESLKIYDEIHAEYPLEKAILSTGRAYALSLQGNNAQAVGMLRAIVSNGGDFTAILAQSILTDFAIFHYRGIELPCEKELREEILKMAQPSLSGGLNVVQVIPRGQCAKIGIKVGDRLTWYDGYPVTDLQQFIYARQMDKFWEKTNSREMRILRNGEIFKFTVNPGLVGLGLTQ